jgi:hypothetical protein
LFLVRRYPLGAVGALIVVLFVTTAVFADALTTFDPFTTNARASLAPPGGAHALGGERVMEAMRRLYARPSPTAPASRWRSASAPPRSAV